LIRQVVLQTAIDNGRAGQFKGFAERCMAEHDLHGWTAPDLINPNDVNLLWHRFKGLGRSR